MTNKVEVFSFEPQYADDFYKINHQWISEMFKVEGIDEQVISNPESEIIATGGEILFASTKEHGVVGTGALRPREGGFVELTKMGVLPKARGLKVGEILLQALIDKSVEMGVETLYLLTNKNCEAAIHLYEKLGFVHCEKIRDKFAGDYERCNVSMRYIQLQ